VAGCCPVCADDGYVPVDVRDYAPRNPDASRDILTNSRDSALASNSGRRSDWHGNRGRHAISAVAKVVYGLADKPLPSNTVDQDFADEGKKIDGSFCICASLPLGLLNKCISLSRSAGRWENKNEKNWSDKVESLEEKHWSWWLSFD
jgi:hypothetical protein